MLRKSRIYTEDISFVVQGAICGPATGSNQYTRITCSSIRRYFPKAEIILSTWIGMDTAGIDYDKVLYSENIEMTYIIRDDGTCCPNTVNHQILTTKVGIAAATRKYVIKVRSDLEFIGNGLLKYIGKYNKYSENSEDSAWRIFSERILCLPTYNPRRKMVYPYNICDWIYAGKREDINELFNIPLMDLTKLKCDGNNYPTVHDNMGAEQYIWVSCLKNHGLPAILDSASDTGNDAVRRSERALANNIVLLSARKMKIKSLKTGYSGYCSEPWLSQGFYTFSEWKRLYNRYAGGNCLLSYNLIEDMFYWVVSSIRTIVQSKNMRLYSAIIYIVRKYRGGN